ncbi:VOC family protein [Pseudomonas syringae]|uniref:VOC family protein n=1 Tax=Pseudomonas syringae TaxID=317 RepID=UPI001BCE94F4|nr:VOC family protein [Pseudomonas syringae]MBS7470258.1 VOC family protein [Pseudomonas syringae]
MFGFNRGKKVRFSHTNIVSADWKRLSKFYRNVFGCHQVGPVRKLSGDAVSGGTGVPDAIIEGIHLSLPDCEDSGITLEIFQYMEGVNREVAYANSRGITHLAFEVEDLVDICAKVVRNGGWMLGKVVKQNVKGVGVCEFLYVRDPERNIIEIQKWTKPEKRT